MNRKFIEELQICMEWVQIPSKMPSSTGQAIWSTCFILFISLLNGGHYFFFFHEILGKWHVSCIEWNIVGRGPVSDWKMLSFHIIQEILRLRCSFLSRGLGFPHSFKLVYLGEFRLVYLGIWACLLTENKLCGLLLLPFWTCLTVPFPLFCWRVGWSQGRKQILRTVFILCG